MNRQLILVIAFLGNTFFITGVMWGLSAFLIYLIKDLPFTWWWLTPFISGSVIRILAYYLLHKQIKKEINNAFKKMSDNKQIFWKDDFPGAAIAGIYLRNDLKKFFDTLAEKGIVPVGIVYDGSFNLEILVEDNEAAQKHFSESGDREK